MQTYTAYLLGKESYYMNTVLVKSIIHVREMNLHTIFLTNTGH